MPEDPTPHGSDPFDEALDRVLDQDPATRSEFVRTTFAEEPELMGRLLELVEASDATDAVLSRAEAAALDLLDDDAALEDGEPVLPDSIGPYVVLDRLGSGGMGTVYLAERRDGDTDRQVAIKVISEAAHRPEVRQRFLAERRILSRLEHPNIARLYDVGVEESGVPYLVMEYVRGSPIDSFADENRLSVDDRLDLIGQVLDALAHAHRQLIVHRDVKPSNILVTPDGSVKLLDFGVAKLLDDDGAGAPLTRAGAPVLTPEYASPEQVRGEAVTTSADVYAVGVLLYELLVGTRPYQFQTRSPVHIEQVVSDQDPKVPSSAALAAADDQAAARATTPTRLSRRLAGDLDAILLTALRKEPDRRYGSVHALAADIDRHQGREPIEARPPTWRYRAGRFASRHRLPLGAAALLVLALAGGLGATWWQARAAIRQAERAERVKDLLVGLFEGADPDVASGEELSAVDLLARGEETLLTGLDDEPEIRAELQQIVGTIYTSLGEYDRAGPLLEASLELSSRFAGEEGRAEAQGALLGLLHATGDFAEGERIARERLDIRRATEDEGSVEIASALTDLATFVQNQGRLDEAEAILREGLDLDRQAGDAGRVATDLNNLGTLLGDQGRFDEAIVALEESLQLRSEQHAGPHTDVATSLANLAWALDRKGEFDRADSAYEATLAMRRHLLGNEHPLIATVLNNQASMRQVQSRLEEARELHTEALRIRRAVFGNDHSEVAGSLNNLAIVSYFEQDFASAAESFREALRIFRSSLPEDHPDVLTTIANLGAVLRAQGELDEAETLIRGTLETRIEVLGPDHPSTGVSWNNLGLLLRLQERYAEAEEATVNAIEIFRGSLSPDHPDLAAAVTSMGRILAALGRAGEWVAELDESCAYAAEQYEADNLTLADCRSALGLALLDVGDESRAMVELSASVPRLEEARPGDEWTLRTREALDALSGS